jgi:hypothetical protein
MGPLKHESDLLSPAAIRDYFGEVYRRKDDGFDRIGAHPSSVSWDC